MGIKNLNRYLLENCTNKSIRKIHLSDLSGKCLAIDTSIYMYKYAADNMLIENMYLLISVFKNYKIVPIFIFDGKPPNEKRELLKRRRFLKTEAETKYNELKMNPTPSIQDIKAMETLKRQFVSITDEDIKKVKMLMDCYGVTYYQSKGEADQLCCHFVQTNKVWGCLSEDMDMFAYGCNRVLRGISLLNHTVMLYKTPSILKELNVSFEIFQYILIVCGTDYNLLPTTAPPTPHPPPSPAPSNKEHPPPSIYSMFSFYKKYLSNNDKSTNTLDFHNWILQQNGHSIDSINEYMKIKQLFDITSLQTVSIPPNLLGVYNIKKLIEFLCPYGFVFPRDIY